MSKTNKVNRFNLLIRFNPFQILEENVFSYKRSIEIILHKDLKSALSEDLKAIKKDGETAIKKHESELEALLCP